MAIAPLFQIGPRIAGSVLGSPYQHYRPATANNPLASGNLVGTLPAWITADEDGRGRKSNNYGKPVWYGLFDPAAAAVGDYLVGPLGTFFVAGLNVPMPLQLIQCNRVLVATNPATLSTFGPTTTYGSDQRATESVVASAWPASVVQGTKAHTGDTRLPADVEMAWASILLPAIPGVMLRNNMVLTDELGQRRIISSAELTSLGWRLTTLLATT